MVKPEPEAMEPSVDVSKLTPAPWHVWRSDTRSENVEVLWEYPPPGGVMCVADEVSQENAAFIVLARNAFDVMMRRGWGVVEINEEWTPMFRDEDDQIIEAWSQKQSWHDPFTALVESDKWYREHVEGK